MDIKVLVAAHKQYRMPTDDIYLPIQVGAYGKEYLGYQRDDEGENISESNSRLCELTAIYWAWKNLKADYVGLTHYRRHFTTCNFVERVFQRDKFSCIANRRELESILRDKDLIVPNKRKYYIETMESHFLHLPYTFEKDYQVLKEVIREKEPEYVVAFEAVMHRTSAHMFNMFIMKKKHFDKYCEWLFPIVLEADKRIDVSGYDRMQARVVAYYGEFMLDVWNEKQKIDYKELPVMFMEKQNWVVKGGKFILRKCRKKEQEHSCNSEITPIE